MSSFRLSYTPAFDGLRGAAILLVMLHHTNLPSFQGGYVGVDVFFTLSGFLIASLLIQEFEAHGRIRFRHFYLRRALRLLPALVVLILVLNVYTRLFAPWDTFWRMISDSVVALAYLSNWVFATGDGSLYLMHTWSLAIEEQFYLLFPALLVFLLGRLSRRGVARALLGLAAVSCLWGLALLLADVRWLRVYFGLDTRLWEMLLGGALAALLSSPLYGRFQSIVMRHRVRVELLAISACVILIALTLWVGVVYPLAAYAALFLAALSTVVLIVTIVILEQSVLTRAFAWPPLVALGKISYALYLWHVPIFAIVGVATSWPLATSVALSCLMAVLSYRLVEQPLLRLKARYQR